MTALFLQGRMVGELNYHTGEFVKKVHQSKHLFRRENGYGISKSVLAKIPKGFMVRIINVEGWDEHTAPVERFTERGAYVAYDDPQYVLPLSEFNEAKEAQTVQPEGRTETQA